MSPGCLRDLSHLDITVRCHTKIKCDMRPRCGQHTTYNEASYVGSNAVISSSGRFIDEVASGDVHPCADGLIRAPPPCLRLKVRQELA